MSATRLPAVVDGASSVRKLRCASAPFARLREKVDARYPQVRLDARARACDNGPMESSAVIKAVGFVHLHVHSAYSLREGALSIETLAKLAKADAMPALAITDANNLFGALEFSEKLAKSGVQPIIGAQITVDFGDAAPAFWRGVERDNARAPIVLLGAERSRLPQPDPPRLRPLARSQGWRRSAYPVCGA